MSDALPEPAVAADAESASNPYAVFRNRDFTLFITSRFLQSFAQQMLAVAVGWEIYERTGSSLALGLVGLVQIVPMFLFIFPAGHVADNYSRKQVIIWSQLALVIACAGLAAVSAFQKDVVWAYAALFGFGIARTYYWPTNQSFLPQLVSRPQFARAVGWSTGTFQVASVTGPALGGWLIAQWHSAVPVYVFNVVAGLICMALVARVRTHHKAPVKAPMSWASVAAGLKFVYHEKVVLGTITLDLFAVLLGGATAMLPVYAKSILHTGPNGLGWLQAALPLGSLLTSLILVHRPPLEKAGRTLLLAVAIFGLATIVFGLSRSFTLCFGMLFICGASDYVSVVVRQTLVQLRTPDEMRGRVSAVNSLFIGTSNQMGEFESGLVASFTSPVFSVVSGGVGTVLVVIAAAILWPESGGMVGWMREYCFFGSKKSKMDKSLTKQGRRVGNIPELSPAQCPENYPFWPIFLTFLTKRGLYKRVL